MMANGCFFPMLYEHINGLVKVQEIIYVVSGSYLRDRLIVFRPATEKEEEKFKAKVENLNLQI